MQGGSPQFERRSHFGVRLVLLTLLTVPPPLLLLGARVGVVSWSTFIEWMPWTGLVALGSIFVSGPVLFRELGPSSGSEPDDSGGGGGPGPEPPPPDRAPSGGGIPLPDADQARERVRDHNRRRRQVQPRRRVREPERAPSPAVPAR